MVEKKMPLLLFCGSKNMSKLFYFLIKICRSQILTCALYVVFVLSSFLLLLIASCILSLFLSLCVPCSREGMSLLGGDGEGNVAGGIGFH